MANIYLFVNPNAECEYCTGQYADIIVFADTEERAVDLASRLAEGGYFDKWTKNYWVEKVSPELVGYSHNRNDFATGRWKEYISFE